MQQGGGEYVGCFFFLSKRKAHQRLDFAQVLVAGGADVWAAGAADNVADV